MGGEALPDVRLQLLCHLLRRRVAFLQHDHGLDHFGPERIRLADRGRQRDCWMALQTRLDLAGADPVPAAGDQIVVASDEPEVPGLVARA